jgi:hypothetical protein
MFLGAVKLVGELGDVKDEAEVLFNSRDDGQVLDMLEGDLADEARSIKAEIDNTRVLSKLIGEIKACY